MARLSGSTSETTIANVLSVNSNGTNAVSSSSGIVKGKVSIGSTMFANALGEAVAGTSQFGIYNLACFTNDSNVKTMTTDWVDTTAPIASTANQIYIPPGKIYSFNIVANANIANDSIGTTYATKSATFVVSGLVQQLSSSGVCELIGNPKSSTKSSGSLSALGFSVAFQAQVIALKVTGLSNKAIRWSATATINETG
jgi:hypothetical protein